MFQNYDIPNRIKQPTRCCESCGKSYKKIENLKKHTLICNLLDKIKKTNNETDIDDEETLPSQKQMYSLLIELTKKCNKLEESLAEMSKSCLKKREKINMIEWLNTNMNPSLTFDEFMNNINITDDQASIITEKSFYDSFHLILTRIFCSFEEKKKLPIFIVSKKTNTFYIYNNKFENKKEWILFSREKFIQFLNVIHVRWIYKFEQWRKIKITDSTIHKDNFTEICNKAILKLVSIEFNQESTFSKVKSMIIHICKTGLEFEE
jgi:hypothetical protein